MNEEEFKPLSLFQTDYNPTDPTRSPHSLCGFEILHPNLRFIFEKPRGKQMARDLVF